MLEKGERKEGEINLKMGLDRIEIIFVESTVRVVVRTCRGNFNLKIMTKIGLTDSTPSSSSQIR